MRPSGRAPRIPTREPVRYGKNIGALHNLTAQAHPTSSVNTDASEGM
jgi:hypothetical protein